MLDSIVENLITAFIIVTGLISMWQNIRTWDEVSINLTWWSVEDMMVIWEGVLHMVAKLDRLS